jgi:putative FmdB family regulatory protein
MGGRLMANYEYKCEKCNTVYEVLDYKNDANRKRPCPKCKTMNAKTMNAAAIVLKRGGVGWAKDSYNAPRSLADGPEPTAGDRHKRSGKTVVPVRGGLKLEPDKSTDKKKKPMLKVK